MVVMLIAKSLVELGLFLIEPNPQDFSDYTDYTVFTKMTS